MPFEVKQVKQYPKSSAAVYEAAMKAVDGLGGKVLRQKPDSGEIEATFDKKILGQVLGDRTQMAAKVTLQDGESSSIAIEVYPLDAIGRKLMFGARKGVSETVATWFFAHLEHHLEK
jgi:hypothetical protein